MSKPKTVRRVVTGHRADGRSTVEPAELAALR